MVASVTAHPYTGRRTPIALAFVAALTLAACGSATTTPRPSATSPTATATATATVGAGDGPGHGTPAVVSLGDSYISGEGGRWAGNVNLVGRLDSTAIDALGPSAYHDNAAGDGELIVGCHRSKSAEIHLGTAQDGSPLVSINLACSGATTQTNHADPTDPADYKPGLDAFGDADGNLATDEPAAPGARISQAVALRHAALTHNVTMVVVSIGGNNFHFADLIEQCVKDFLLSSSVARTTATTTRWRPTSMPPARLCANPRSPVPCRTYTTP